MTLQMKKHCSRISGFNWLDDLVGNYPRVWFKDEDVLKETGGVFVIHVMVYE